MKSYNKLLILFLVLTLSFVGTVQPSNASSATTRTFALNRKRDLVVTQNAYLPDRTVFDIGLREYYESIGETPQKSEQYGLKRPQDLFIDAADNIFIADTGNARIVVYDIFTNTVEDIIESDKFIAPRGVFVTQDNDIYVADSGYHAVLKIRYLSEEEDLEDLYDKLVLEEQERFANSKDTAFTVIRSSEYFDFLTDQEIIDMVEVMNYITIEDAYELFLSTLTVTEEEYGLELGQVILDQLKEDIANGEEDYELYATFEDYIDSRGQTEQELLEQYAADELERVYNEMNTTLTNNALYAIELRTIDPLSEGYHIVDVFDKPTSVSFESKSFDPKKVAVDNQDNIYVVAEGLLDGIVQLNDSGEFQGYFASNDVVLSTQQIIENILLSDEQLENRADRVAPPFSNIYVDHKGIKYSTSLGEGGGNLKKHNTDGSNNILPTFLDDLRLIDLTTSKDGIIYTANEEGLIDVWTNDGAFIFRFGASESSLDIAGLYTDLVSIAVDSSGHLWTLDGQKSFMQSYEPTEYASTIYEALELYQNGKYDDAIDKWESVLKLNQLSILAHNEIGRNLFSIGEYERAMYHFELAGNRLLYSDAYWEVRNIALQRNLPFILASFFLFMIGYYVVKGTNRKYQYLATPVAKIKKFGEIKFVNDLLFMKDFIRHPLDSFYYLKRGQKGSYLGATIIYFVFFIVYIVFLTSKGFIYQWTDAADLDLLAVVLGFFGLSILFIICNYLVTSINDGEGSMGQIYKGVMYSTLPLMLAYISTTYLSYYLTFNEVFILQSLYMTGLFWTALLIYLAVQEIHGYTIRQSIKSILMTFLFMIIIIILLAFVQIMGDQLIQYIIALFKEVFRNVIY